MDRKLRDYLRRLGKKGGKKAAGAGPRARWAKLSAEQRAAIMRRVRAGKKGRQR